MRNGQNDQLDRGEPLTCGTCYHFKRNPLANPLDMRNDMACLAHPPQVVLRIINQAIDGIGQTYPTVTQDTTACGEHITPDEYTELRGLTLGDPKRGLLVTGR